MATLSLVFPRFSLAMSAPLKGLSNQFFTFLQERGSVFGIERIGAHSFASGGNGDVVRHDLADVAVLAVS
jgi:hypothetical protein